MLSLFIYLFIYLEVQRLYSAIGCDIFSPSCKQGDIILAAQP